MAELPGKPADRYCTAAIIILELGRRSVEGYPDIRLQLRFGCLCFCSDKDDIRLVVLADKLDGIQQGAGLLHMPDTDILRNVMERDAGRLNIIFLLQGVHEPLAEPDSAALEQDDGGIACRPLGKRGDLPHGVYIIDGKCGKEMLRSSAGVE